MAPPALSAEMLRIDPISMRAKHWLMKMAQAGQRLGIPIVESDHGQGRSAWLFLWGPGHPSRIAPMRDQLAKGGHVIACDLAYWDRDHSVRIAIDAAHPQSWILHQTWPRHRFEATQVPVRDTWNQDGPIVLAGVGPKAVTQYGQIVEEWEHDMVRVCQARWTRPILYKPKKPTQGHLHGTRLTRAPIEELLTGASLLITWHSNCAVDAIRHGVPVVCRDGAAAAVYPAEFAAEDPRPISIELRDRFLGNLAWFQWTPDEALDCWQWLRELLG